MRDIADAFRLWRLHPGSMLAAFAVLTISLGATTSLFSVVNGLLLSPLPVADAPNIVRITAIDNHAGPAKLSLPDFIDLKNRMRSADSMASYREVNANIRGNGKDNSLAPIVVHALEIDADLFRVLGVRMAQGRPFPAAANQPGHDCEIVISWSLWKSRFNGEVVAQKPIRLNEQLCNVDGVLPEHMDLPVDADLWMPMPFDPGRPANARGIHSMFAMAHLKNGANVSAANAELSNVAGQMALENPTLDSGLRLRATNLREWLSQDTESTILILFASVVGVLLLACANVANLLLARAASRSREMAVRAAVGATRVALCRQLLTESLLLALISSAGGLALSFLVVRWISGLPNLKIPRVQDLSLDWRVALFALSAAGFTGMIFGVLPALKVSLTSMTSVLSQAGGRITESKRQQFIRKVLVGFETGLATVLLLGSLLMLRSFSEISKLNLGFKTDHLMTAYISLNPQRYKYTSDYSKLARDVLEKLKGKGGVVAAALATTIPLQAVTSGSGPVQIEGRPLPVNPMEVLVINTGVSPSFRSTLSIPLKAGVDLEDRDDNEDATATLVNEALVQQFFPNQPAIGRRFRYSPITNPEAPWQQITGVIGNTRQAGPETEARPEIYRPFSRATTNLLGIIVRTTDDPARHLRDILTALKAVDPELPILYPRTMEEVESRKLGFRTFTTSLITGFAGVAVLLASGGIFALIAYSISQRTSEIGVRMACGASRADVLRMVAVQGLLPAFIGIVLGILADIFLARYLSSLLYGVQPTDLRAYVGTVTLLAISSVVAALVPAYRAAQTEPWRALRYE